VLLVCELPLQRDRHVHVRRDLELAQLLTKTAEGRTSTNMLWARSTLTPIGKP
jgi:hypothetical protein